ncbi:MAG: hypothetical protein ACJ789_19460 [Thermomicrobiales bacterium]
MRLTSSAYTRCQLDIGPLPPHPNLPAIRYIVIVKPADQALLDDDGEQDDVLALAAGGRTQRPIAAEAAISREAA